MTSSGGSSSASTTKNVPAGGSSMVLSSFGPASFTRWNSSSSSTLRVPSMAERLARRMISSAWPTVMSAPSRATMIRSGCCSWRASRRDRAAPSSSPAASSRRPADRRRTPGPRPACRSRAGRRTARRGACRREPRGRSMATAASWPTTSDHASSTSGAPVTALMPPHPTAGAPRRRARTRRLHLVDRTGAVDHHPTVGIVGGQHGVALGHPLVEVVAGGLEPVGLAGRGQAGAGLGGRAPPAARPGRGPARRWRTSRATARRRRRGSRP